MVRFWKMLKWGNLMIPPFRVAKERFGKGDALKQLPPLGKGFLLVKRPFSAFPNFWRIPDLCSMENSF